MEQLATDCLEIQSDKGITKAILAGHSMRTRVVIETHRQAPDIVKGLILMDGSNATSSTDLDTALAGFQSTDAELRYAGSAKMLFARMFYDSKHDAWKERFIECALKVPEDIGTPLHKNIITWDGTVSSAAMQAANILILVVQSTTRDAKDGRRALEPGEVNRTIEAWLDQHSLRSYRQNIRTRKGYPDETHDV